MPAGAHENTIPERLSKVWFVAQIIYSEIVESSEIMDESFCNFPSSVALNALHAQCSKRSLCVDEHVHDSDYNKPTGSR